VQALQVGAGVRTERGHGGELGHCGWVPG
jgi:hypothetical protein